MPTPVKSVLLYSVPVVCAALSVVCAVGWFQAREDSRRLREMNRTLVAQISSDRKATLREKTAEVRDFIEKSFPDEDGQLVLPPGLGQEFPELQLPMTPDRAADFERRQFDIPTMLLERSREW